MTVSAGKRVLTRARMLGWLEELGASPDSNGLTVSLRAGSSVPEIEKHLKELPAHPDTIGYCTERAGQTGTGTVIVWGRERKYLIHPPFPVAESCIVPAVDVQTLYDTLSHNYLIAYILVRLGSYAVGVSRGETLLTSKVGTGNVHGRHKKGGSSAHRFERHRDKQIEYFMTRLCQRAREHVEPFLKTLDYLVYGGAWTTVEILQKQCGFVSRLDTPQLPPLLDIPEPRQSVLKSAVTTAWSSTIYEFRED